MAKSQNIRLLTRSEFARRVGRSLPTVSAQFKAGGKLAHGLHRNKIDTHHPDVAAYMEKCAATPTGTTPGVPVASTKRAGKWVEAIAADPQVGLSAGEFEALTMREVAMRFGTLPACKAAVDILKSLTVVKNQDVTREAKRGELVRRDMVEGSLVSIVDLAFRRIVEENPLALAPKVVAMVKAGGDGVVQDVTEAIRGESSRTLKACKAELLKQIDGLRKG